MSVARRYYAEHGSRLLADEARCSHGIELLREGQRFNAGAPQRIDPRHHGPTLPISPAFTACWLDRGLLGWTQMLRVRVRDLMPLKLIGPGLAAMPWDFPFWQVFPFVPAAPASGHRRNRAHRRLYARDGGECQCLRHSVDPRHLPPGVQPCSRPSAWPKPQKTLQPRNCRPHVCRLAECPLAHGFDQ
jgi:hypothetical protein